MKVVYLDFDWDGLLPALMSGKADILAADMTPTLARATKVGFTKPFMYVGAVAFSKGDGAFKTVDGLQGAPARRSRCSSVRPVRNSLRWHSRKARSNRSRVRARCSWTRSLRARLIAD